MKSLSRLESSWHADASTVTTPSHAVLIAEARRHQAEILTSLLRKGAHLLARYSGLPALSRRFARYRSYRHTVVELQRLDDASLRDIGLTRSEIQRVALGNAGLPVEAGPSLRRRAAESFARWLDYRETRRQLYGLDDATLRDIGLQRGDIDRIARGSAYGAAPAAQTAPAAAAPQVEPAPKPAADITAVRPAPAYTETEHAKAA